MQKAVQQHVEHKAYQLMRAVVYISTVYLRETASLHQLIYSVVQTTASAHGLCSALWRRCCLPCTACKPYKKLPECFKSKTHGEQCNRLHCSPHCGSLLKHSQSSIGDSNMCLQALIMQMLTQTTSTIVLWRPG